MGRTQGQIEEEEELVASPSYIDLGVVGLSQDTGLDQISSWPIKKH